MLAQHLHELSLPRVRLLELFQLLALFYTILNPPLKLVIVDEDFVCDRAEVFTEREDVTTIHRLSVIFPEDVIELLLCHKAIPIWVNLAELQRNLFQLTVIYHHGDKLGL